MLLLCYLLLLFQNQDRNIRAEINGGPVPISKTYEISIDDTLKLSPTKKNGGQWISFSPVLKEYSNYQDKNPYAPAKIEYTGKSLTDNDTINALKYFKNCGTYYVVYFCNEEICELADTLRHSAPLPDIYTGRIVQIVIRKDSSYIGYLYELINTPFILPPGHIPGYGHQTDLRIGSDCAEFAIYGKRRQGYDIPYCGPKNIYKYLNRIEENELKAGDIIHFGEQVSVFYEDKGTIAKFDAEDILCQSYGSTVYFTSYKDCGFYGRSCRFYRWREEYR